MPTMMMPMVLIMETPSQNCPDTRFVGSNTPEPSEPTTCDRKMPMKSHVTSDRCRTFLVVFLFLMYVITNHTNVSPAKPTSNTSVNVLCWNCTMYPVPIGV